MIMSFSNISYGQMNWELNFFGHIDATHVLKKDKTAFNKKKTTSTIKHGVKA